MKFPVVLFDWADTVMVDTDPTSPLPMCEWKDLRAVPGIAGVLDFVQKSGRKIVLATSAAVSDEAQIRKALSRVGVEGFFVRVFCQRNTGLPKSEAFYRKIVSELGVNPTEVVMIGDAIEKDVAPAEKAGISAVWFNEGGKKKGEAKITVRSMEELVSWFKSMDA